MRRARAVAISTAMPIARRAATLVLALAATAARGEIVTKTVEYRHGDTVLEGYLAYDSAGPAKKPGVLVFHQWKGLTAYERKRAEQLAALGYVAFAADVYGKGVRPADPKAAGAEAGKYRGDRALLRGRAQAALAALRQQPNVDREKVAAIGYCFGGMAVLELARSGAPLAAVGSFHGLLTTRERARPGEIAARIFASTGALDPLVPPADIATFQAEMTAAGADWLLLVHGRAMHSFTNRDVDGLGDPRMRYDAAADRQSWGALLGFLDETLA